MGKRKEKINDFLNNRLLPTMGKIGAQKHLSALRDGFAMFVPLVIVGAISLIFITFVFGGWGTNKTSIFGWISNAAGTQQHTYAHLRDSSVAWTTMPNTNWATVQIWAVTLFSWVNAATIGLISVYVALFIGFSMSITRNYKNPILGSGIALMAFVIFTGGQSSKFGATGMLTAIIGSLAAVEFFTFLIRINKFAIKMPSGVPPAISKSFAILIPAILTAFACVGITILFALPYYFIMPGQLLKSVSDIIIDLVQAPFISFAKNGGDIGLLFVYVIGVDFLFFFGIHGPNTLNGLFSPLAILLWIDNMSGGNNVFTDGTYNGFIFFGGTGATLPLLFLMIFILKNGSPSKEVAKYAIPSGVFNINEPALFGIPIVFNFVLFIPFMFGSIFAAIFVTIAIKAHLMNPHTIAVPWTTPPIIYGLLATGMDWRSVIVSVINIIVVTLTYLPFVFIIKRQENKMIDLEKQVKQAKNNLEVVQNEV